MISRREFLQAAGVLPVFGAALPPLMGSISEIPDTSAVTPYSLDGAHFGVCSYNVFVSASVRIYSKSIEEIWDSINSTADDYVCMQNPFNLSVHGLAMERVAAGIHNFLKLPPSVRAYLRGITSGKQDSFSLPAPYTFQYNPDEKHVSLELDLFADKQEDLQEKPDGHIKIGNLPEYEAFTWHHSGFVKLPMPVPAQALPDFLYSLYKKEQRTQEDQHWLSIIGFCCLCRQNTGGSSFC
jgi:hypothetical protein